MFFLAVIKVLFPLVDLQLKKLAIDKKHGEGSGNTVEGEGYIITDRNSILQKLKDLNK